MIKYFRQASNPFLVRAKPYQIRLVIGLEYDPGLMNSADVAAQLGKSNAEIAVFFPASVDGFPPRQFVTHTATPAYASDKFVDLTSLKENFEVAAAEWSNDRVAISLDSTPTAPNFVQLDATATKYVMLCSVYFKTMDDYLKYNVPGQDTTIQISMSAGGVNAYSTYMSDLPGNPLLVDTPLATPPVTVPVASTKCDCEPQWWLLIAGVIVGKVMSPKKTDSPT